MCITWPDLVLPPINQPVLISALDFELLNQGESMKTIEQELEELREKIAHQDSCLDKQYLIQERQKQQYATLLESFEKQQKKIEAIEERIKMQQKQIDIAMHYIFALQEKCGNIADK